MVQGMTELHAMNIVFSLFLLLFICCVKPAFLHGYAYDKANYKYCGYLNIEEFQLY